MPSRQSPPHRRDVNRQSVQPSREGRFATKRVNFAKQEQEGFLSQILCFSRISYHAQTYRIYTSAMRTIEVFKRRRIALARSLDRSCFAQLIAANSGDWRRILLQDAIRAGTRIPV